MKSVKMKKKKILIVIGIIFLLVIGFVIYDNYAQNAHINAMKHVDNKEADKFLKASNITNKDKNYTYHDKRSAGTLIIPKLKVNYDYFYFEKQEKELDETKSLNKYNLVMDNNFAIPNNGSDTVSLMGHVEKVGSMIESIKTGDDIYLNTANGKVHYRVNKIKIVNNNDTRDLQKTGKEKLILYTCHNYSLTQGTYTQKYLVIADKV